MNNFNEIFNYEIKQFSVEHWHDICRQFFQSQINRKDEIENRIHMQAQLIRI